VNATIIQYTVVDIELGGLITANKLITNIFYSNLKNVENLYTKCLSNWQKESIYPFPVH